MREIFQSIFLLLFISGSLAGLLNLGFNKPFWSCFFITIIVQFIVYDLYRRWLSTYSKLQEEEIKNNRLKEYSKQGLICTCPDENCNYTLLVPIVLNDENIYDCPKCNKTVKVYIGAKTYLTTEPVDENPFKNFDFPNNKDYDS